MPRQQTSKRRNTTWADWVDQGLKPSSWSARRVAQIGLLIGLALAIAALYLLQSSEIVTASRRVQDLRAQLAQLQQDNAEVSSKISAAGSIEQLKKRAEALGFGPPASLVYLPVRYLPLEDVRSIQDVYLIAVTAGQ
ncbi:MAG TPA: hypothetical protein VFF59_01815 [Anaerolineae bacterium]|jgi:outer membrane murein-binding lipoprotein Lpp|nr:hypothetical protein [Anaerolineae bacterium]